MVLTRQISDPAPVVSNLKPERSRGVHCIWFVRHHFDILRKTVSVPVLSHLTSKSAPSIRTTCALLTRGNVCSGLAVTRSCLSQVAVPYLNDSLINNIVSILKTGRLANITAAWIDDKCAPTTITELCNPRPRQRGLAKTVPDQNDANQKYCDRSYR